MIVAIATGLASTSKQYGDWILYAGYGVAIGLFAFAIVVSGREMSKPFVVPIRYGREPDNHCGLIIANDNESEPAYDIFVLDQTIAVGSWTLYFLPSVIPRLTKESGSEALFQTGVELSSRMQMTGDALFNGMVKNTITAITLTLVYKDRHNRWYKSICRIERDVLASGGLRTGLVRQRRWILGRWRYYLRELLARRAD